MIKLNVRFPDDLYEQIKNAAAADDRSLNSWLVSLARQAVKETPNRPGGDSASPAPLRGSGHSPHP